MKRFIAIVLAALTLGSISAPASAYVAHLRNCQQSRSISGQVIWVGTYEVNGQYFREVFTSWCPSSLQVQ